MSESSQVSALLIRWVELREQGQQITPEDLCRDCPDLLPEVRRRIEVMLAWYRTLEGGDSDATTPPDTAPAVPATHWTSATLPAGPERLAVPGYEVLEELGRGGMGVVYKARQVKLDRLIALKMIRDGVLAGPEQLGRFHKEAHAIARLKHPNIVQIHDIGEHGDRPYLCLELIEGGNLAQKIQGRPQPAAWAAQLVETLARAMHYAHQQGIVHRDLKPANVLLSPDGVPKVTDFGLAKHLEAEVFLTHTPSQALMGTPSYMAPEQASGPSKEVGPAADIYALGAILYECLTGRPPFLAERLLDTLEQVRTLDPVPPRRLNPEAPRDLDTICLKCLRKEPEKRYATAEELADDLRRFQAGEPIRARPASAGERVLRWARRRPAAALLLAVSCLAALLLVAGLAASNFLIRHGRRQTQEALQRETQALEGIQAEQQNTRVALERETQALGERTVALRSLEGEQKKTRDALEQATRANDGLAKALAELRAEKETAYLQRIALAERLLLANNHERSGQLLDECLPQSRQWEWHLLRRRCQGQKGLALGPHPSAANALAFSPDGKQLAAACANGEVKLWNAATGEAAGTLSGHNGEALAVAFSPDGNRLASASQPGRGKGPDAGKKTQTPRTGDAWAAGLPAAPGELLVHLTAAEKYAARSPIDSAPPEAGEVKTWDMASGKVLYTIPFPGQAAAVAFSPDGKWLATAGRNLVAVSAPPLPQRPGRDEEVRLSPGAGDVPLQVALADLRTPAVIMDSPPWVLAVAEEAPKAEPRRAELTLRDAATGKEVRKLAGIADGTLSLAFGPDGKHLASAGADGMVRVWEVETGREMLTLRGHGRPVRQVAFSPDGKRLASAGADEKVRVWDTDSGQEILTLIGHAGPVTGLTFQAGGKRLATAGEDKTVKVWDAVTGQEVLTLRDSARAVHAVAFSPDGHRLASAGADAVVRVWDGTPLTGPDSR